MYSPPTRRDFLERSALALAGSVASFGCGRKRQAPRDATKMPPTLPSPSNAGRASMRAHADAVGLLAGCAVVPKYLASDAAYAGAVAAYANIVVAENAMKWPALQPEAGSFAFADADSMIAFAEAHQQKVRGHNLCWHEALPHWFAATVTASNARQVLTRHIETVAGHFAGRLHSWDVVNEAVEPKDGRADGLRKSPWLELAGPDYIELAFRTARRADPTALLTYNDFGFELDTPEQAEKRGQILMLVRRLKARGVPIDAVGIQSHLMADGPRPGAGLRDFVRALRQFQLQVFVTELDVNDRNLTGSIDERDEDVAAVYRDHLSLLLAEPNVTSVLTWGITDRFTWLNTPSQKPRADGLAKRPLPLDADYQPVPAFFAMRDAIDRRHPLHSGETEPRRLPSNPYAPFTPKHPADQAPRP